MTDGLLGFSQLEKESIIRLYLGAGAEAEWPLCRHCGEEFRFERETVETGAERIRVRCPGCANGFTWTQSNPARPWKPLHLNYFKERLRASQPLRCPLDDCGVTAIELPGGDYEFRCPFCNSRGRVPSEDLENLPG